MLVATNRRVGLIGLSSILLFVVWVFLILFLAPQYQNTAGADPLAMINVLFPSFWILLLAYVLIFFSAFVLQGTPRWLHMLLLAQFALILYYTPFLLSGFSWSPDSLWHGGVASYMPQILSGHDFVLTDYAHAYPLMFSLTYVVEWISGMSVFTYSLYVYPVVCTVLFSTLSYFLASRLFNARIAFLAMLFTLPALHYVEMHVSPFSAGTIILLISLILWTYHSKLAIGLSFLSVIALVLVHPVSPLMLGIFFFSVLVINLVFRKRISSEDSATKVYGLAYLVLSVGVWASWTVIASSFYVGVRSAVSNILNFSFLSRLFTVSDFTLGKSGFIYGWIQNLSLGIYALIFGIVFVLVFGGRIVNIRHLRVSSKQLDSQMFKRLVLILASVIYAAISFMLFLSSGERFLLGRGLLYFILMGAMVIATYFVIEGPRWQNVKTFAALALIIFLVCSFPLIAYSKESYNTFTPSADKGLQFLSSKIDLSQNSLSMSSEQQLASYADLSKGLILLPFPPNMTSSSPDVVAMRINGYYLISMRGDLSFTNNSFTRLNIYLENSPDYNKVYSNSQFEIFVKIH